MRLVSPLITGPSGSTLPIESRTRQRCIRNPVARKEPIIILSPEFGCAEITVCTIVSNSALEIVAKPSIRISKT